MNKVTINHFHLFCGLGGGAAGFNRGHARVGSLEARFECIGGIDVDAGAIKDFDRLAGTKGTVMDLFSREQYIAFHGKEPSDDWREATPADIRKAASNKNPHVIFLSAPCKGFSGLLPTVKSKSDKYQALNQLTLRGVWLSLEAFKDDPVPFYLFENVPRIQARGRYLLDQITALFRSYGYAVAESSHDCGELGGLAQSRRRFLLVARHQEKIPPFLYEPQKRPLLSVGDVLSKMPLPGSPEGGAMHRIPSLQWKTWVRLAFVEAGKDWRSLSRLNVDEDGYLKDYLIIPEYRDGFLGVTQWAQPSGTIAGRNTPTNGKFSVADPRPNFGNGAHQNIYRIVGWDRSCKTITSAGHPAAGSGCVADPRGTAFAGKYKVTPYDCHSSTVISGSTTGQGAFAVADPKPSFTRKPGDSYLTAGHYGVIPWSTHSNAVAASACHDNGFWSVADPRTQLPDGNTRLIATIISEDDCWHRPFTTKEVAALQGLHDPDNEEEFILHGLSDSDWRERIGNAVPPPAAEAIACMIGETILLAMAGETFVLGSTPIWVREFAKAIAVHQPAGLYAE